MTQSLAGTYASPFTGDVPSINLELFSSNVFQVAEQKVSKLFGVFNQRETIVGGQQVWIPILDDLEGHDIAGAAQTNTPPWTTITAGGVQTAEMAAGARYSQTRWRYPIWRQRVLFAEEWNWAVPRERNDPMRINVDIDSEYVKKASASLARRLDKIGITALTESVTEYQKTSAQTTTKTSTTKALTDTQDDGTTSLIDDSATGLTIDKIREAKLRFDNREVPEMGRVALIMSSQMDDLLDDSNFTSTDYNTVHALAQGGVDTYMGFRFIRFSTKHNLLTKTGNVRSCIFAHVDALKYGVEEQMFTRVSERDDYNYLKQTYMALNVGAVRISENHVLQVDCIET